MNDMTRLFFSPQGEIDRQVFTLGWLFWLCVETVFLLPLISAGEDSAVTPLLGMMLLAVSLVDTVAVIMLAIKRARALGWPPAIGILTLVPVLSLAIVLVMSSLRTRNEEASGMPPV
ncbi:MAG: DUF805 domain-containing protein [Phyllobacteriaceae bacterium]|nr:DUF805 domain-containing protein [Phyllobacteriaceae bacterium]